MLPTILSHEPMEGVRAFLRAAFPPSTPEFREAFDTILNGIGRDKVFQTEFLRLGGAKNRIKAQFILANRKDFF